MGWKRISIIALIIAVLAAIYFVNMIWKFQNHESGVLGDSEVLGLPPSDTAFNGLFAYASANDSLPHYQYQRIKDSIDRRLMVIKYANRSSGSGWSIGVLGISKIERQFIMFSDSITAKDPESRLLSDSISIVNNMFN